MLLKLFVRQTKENSFCFSPREFSKKILLKFFFCKMSAYHVFLTRLSSKIRLEFSRLTTFLKALLNKNKAKKFFFRFQTL